MFRLYAEELADKDMFYGLIYRDIFQEENSKAFLTLKDKNKRRVSRTLNGIMRHETYCSYFTPNIFWHHKEATKEKMLWLDSIILDFDDAKNGQGVRFSDGGEVAFHVQEKTGFIPRFVWESKTTGNFHALILIHPMTGTPKSIYLYEKMAKAIALKIGADTAATSCNNLIGIPKKRLWHVPGGEIYDIDDFKKWYKQNIEAKKQINVTSLHEHKVWNHVAIQKLLHGEITGWRNRASFTIALLYYSMGKAIEEAHDFLSNEWMPLVNGSQWHEPFLYSEVVSTVKSAYSGKYAGPAKEYIELLTDEEFPYTVTGSVYKKKSIAEGGYWSKDEVKIAVVNFIRENNGITIKQPELAKLINKPLRSVKRVLAELQKEKVLEMQTQLGRYSKGSTIKLLENELETFKTSVIFSEKFNENQLDNFLENIDL